MSTNEMLFTIAGDSSEYEIFISCQDRPILSCSCPAGMNNTICKHRLEILRGDFRRIKNVNIAAHEQLAEILATPGFREIIENFVKPIEEIEIEQARLKKRLSHLKKALARSIAAALLAMICLAASATAASSKGAISIVDMLPKESISGAQTDVLTQAPNASGKVSANVKTKKFHGNVCRFYDCHDCVKQFKSADAARAAGYAACEKCGGYSSY